MQSRRITEVICVPGNGGTAALQGCRNLPLAVDDFEGIARFALVNNIGLVGVGPEQPLAKGITDDLTERNISVFGPTQAGAQIESSKAWAKELMREASIPTAEADVFSDAESAIEYIQTKGVPIVVKADGLAAGKGVTVATTLPEAITAVEAAFGGQFGVAGHRVVIEEYLSGQEASVLAVTDGLTIRPLMPAQDHKPIGEGDTGANTGGMGAYAPTPVITPDLMERIQTEILQPAIETLHQRGIDYRGVLYAGLMITPQGDPKVVEFNCRFGDPETQVVLPLLETPLEEVMLACAQQRLGTLPPINWRSGAAACIVLVAQGYPGRYSKGMPIGGIDQAESTGAYVFHAGTKKQGEKTIANGGRVLGVTAVGETFEAAIANAYNAVSYIEFEGVYYRRDIGYRVKGPGFSN